jgi:hypothetical protein
MIFILTVTNKIQTKLPPVHSQFFQRSVTVNLNKTVENEALYFLEIYSASYTKVQRTRIQKYCVSLRTYCIPPGMCCTVRCQVCESSRERECSVSPDQHEINLLQMILSVETVQVTYYE